MKGVEGSWPYPAVLARSRIHLDEENSCTEKGFCPFLPSLLFKEIK